MKTKLKIGLWAIVILIALATLYWLGYSLIGCPVMAGLAWYLCKEVPLCDWKLHWQEKDSEAKVPAFFAAITVVLLICICLGYLRWPTTMLIGMAIGAYIAPNVTRTIKVRRIGTTAPMAPSRFRR